MKSSAKVYTGVVQDPVPQWFLAVEPVSNVTVGVAPLGKDVAANATVVNDSLEENYKRKPVVKYRHCIPDGGDQRGPANRHWKHRV
jgi:hypothetical protein